MWTVNDKFPRRKVQVLFVQHGHDVCLDTILRNNSSMNAKSKAWFLLSVFQMLEVLAAQKIKDINFRPIKVRVTGVPLYSLFLMVNSSKVLSLRGAMVENSLGL
jgi:hypothetical protein